MNGLLLQITFSPEIIAMISALVFCVVAMFMAGYFYFMKKQETESCNQLIEKKELEKKLGILHAKQEERSRISADLHDDLGAGLTSIRLYSELAIERPGSGSMPEVNRISALSNELINSMNAIIWTMDVANDTLQNLLIFLRKIAVEYFESTNLKLEVNMTDDVSEVEVAGEKRRSIYLVVKEILANILKHSSATEVQINLVYAGKLLITIADNGSGYKPGEKKRVGSGIKNITKRVADLGGKINIEDYNGTHVAVEVPL